MLATDPTAVERVQIRQKTEDIHGVTSSQLHDTLLSVN